MKKEAERGQGKGEEKAGLEKAERESLEEAGCHISITRFSEWITHHQFLLYGVCGSAPVHLYDAAALD